MLRKASADGKIPADARLTSQKERGAQNLAISTVGIVPDVNDFGKVI